MPQPRRSPPRHKIRRSRSYSPGKIQSRSFERKRSRSRERRSSRSPQRKRSEDVKYRSPPPSSHIPRPHFEDKGFPVKRPADSSGKRPVHRSRSPSPSPVKKSKADRAPSPYGKRPAQRSPSPHGGKQRFPNRPEPSSSKAPLFPAAKKQAEIDYVTIVNKGSKMELLSKRFETPDQRLSHGFDFEENITIGIHRGPSHIQLDDGEDVPVNYHFNTKTFRMLFPKKVYDKTLFDRDEIKAFRHDDILDEEAYVEKRTISVKPVDKPKSGKSHDLDYKVSVGRDEYGDRRMVKDSRGHGSRSDMYDDVPVTVRLDPKPDPRYEKLYKEQKRYEDTSMLHDDVQRNPNDLRYNLMRRKSEGDRGDKQGLDARSRIDARRHDDLVSDRHRSSRSLSPEEKYKRRMDQPHLPDFKNRPVVDVPATRPRRWGFCKICKVVLNSELQAHQHVEGSKHRLNEQLVKEGRLPELQESKRAFHELDAESSLEENLPKRRRLSGQGAGFVGAGSRVHEKEGAVEQIARGPGDRAEVDHFDRRREEKYGVGERDDLMSGRRSFEAKHEPTSGHASDISDDGRTKLIWLIGSNQLGAVHNNILNRQHTSFNLGLESRNIAIEWLVWKELALGDVMFQLEKKSAEGTPDCIVLHIGGTELADKKYSIKDELMNVVDAVFKRFQSTKIVWCEIIPDNLGVALARPISVNNIRRSIDDTLASYVLEIGGCYLRLDHDLKNRAMFKFLHDGNLHLSAMGIEKFETILRGGLVSLMARDMKIVPTMKQLPNRVNDFVARNLTMFRRKY